MTIHVATKWPSNAELILDVRALGYISNFDRVLDPTYGRGTWWKLWRPELLTTYDLHTDHADARVDFRDLWLHHDEGSFDVATFDPPYVCVGGRSTSGIKRFLNAYGLDTAPRTPPALQELIHAGMEQCGYVVRPGGRVLVKCANYISSGQLWPGAHLVWQYARALGFKLLDEFVHVGDPRPQPAGRRQVHARCNTSTLYVFERPK
jgi:hypothetical protein